MRVLIILKYIPSKEDDLKSDLLRTTILAHESQGHDVVLLTTGKSVDNNWDEIVIKRSFSKKIKQILAHYLFNKEKNIFDYSKVATFHEQFPIDIILAECTGNYPAIHANNISQILCIPYVIREHKSYKSANINDIQVEYLQALKNANSVLSVSPMLAETMINIGICSKINVIPNALSDEFFEPPTNIEFFKNWAEGSFLFAGWTRWRKFKRIDLLLEAFNQIKERGCNARLIIAGPIEPSDNYEWVNSFIKQNNLENDVLLTGHLTRSEIHQLAYACDCCVVPSDYETFSLPALEAFAAGKPVIATRCGGPEYLIDSLEFGSIVECGSITELYRAMYDIFCEQDSFNEKCISQRTYDRFSRSAISNQFTSLYNDLLK